MVDEYMNGKVPISSNGKSKKVPRLKVFIMTVFRDAMNGDPRARRQLMDLIKLAGLLDPTAVAQPLSHLVIRDLLPNELKRAMLAIQQAPFRDGHKPPLSDEILERYGLLFPDDE